MNNKNSYESMEVVEKSILCSNCKELMGCVERRDKRIQELEALVEKLEKELDLKNCGCNYCD
jgi:hypothetical protein|tara:strand:+ start:1658 stop:1843 length:186 start_codon:yes stop_codon:yes gene_type:complete